MKKLLFSFGVTILSLGGAGLFFAPEASAQSACPRNDCIGTAVFEASGCGTGKARSNLTCAAGFVCCVVGAASGGTGTGTGTGGQGALGATDAVNITLANPLKFSTVDGVLTNIMASLKGIVVTLALLMIVIGAVMYILSFGNPDNIKRAKNIIFAALIGLAIVIAAPAFLREIYSLLGGEDPTLPSGVTQLTLTQIATNILKFLLALVGICALIVMIISALMLFASFGNPEKRKQALEMLKAAIIGVVVAMGSMILVTTVARFFQ